MGNEMPLVVFTVLSQLAIGLLLTSQIAGDATGNNKKRIYTWIFGITAISMLVALMHLGDPFGAYRAIVNVGSSWLSRENIFLGAFLFCIAILFLKVRQDAAVNVTYLGWLGALLGLGAIISTVNIYYLSSIPAWMSEYTYIAFLSAMLILGNSLLPMFLDLNQNKSLRVIKIIVFCNVLLFIVQLAYFVPYLGYLNAEASLSADYIMDHMGMWLFGQSLLLLGILGTGYAVKKHISTQKPVNVWLASGFILAILGIMIGRYLFYASGMPMW